MFSRKQLGGLSRVKLAAENEFAIYFGYNSNREKVVIEKPYIFNNVYNIYMHLKITCKKLELVSKKRFEKILVDNFLALYIVLNYFFRVFVK